MNGSRSARLTPANARRTGKPSPSRPAGAVVMLRTGRMRASGPTSGKDGTVVRSSTVTAGIADPPEGLTPYQHQPVGVPSRSVLGRMLVRRGPSRGHGDPEFRRGSEHLIF